MFSGFDNIKFKFCLHETSSSVNFPFLSILEFAWAIVNLVSSIAERYSILSSTFPSLTFLYGLSINPYLLILEYVDKLFIKPMFGPSGVSIGQILP